MGSIPVTDETLIEIYRCGHCHGAYLAQVGPNYISCCLNHPPGSCCHFAEEAVTPEMLSAVRELLACEGENPVVDWGTGDDIELQTSTVTDGLESTSAEAGCLQTTK